MSTVSAYMNSLRNIVQVMDSIKGEFSRDFYRKEKFLRYIKKGETYCQLYQRLIEGENGPIIIGYGNGLCSAPGIKGASMPVKSFYVFLMHQDKKRIRVIKVNENLTSKMCSVCHCETGSIKCHKEIEVSEGEKEWVKAKIHALRRCKNNECHITWDRDVNASWNIYYLLQIEYTGRRAPRVFMP